MSWRRLAAGAAAFFVAASVVIVVMAVFEPQGSGTPEQRRAAMEYGDSIAMAVALWCTFVHVATAVVGESRWHSLGRRRWVAGAALAGLVSYPAFLASMVMYPFAQRFDSLLPSLVVAALPAALVTGVCMEFLRRIDRSAPGALSGP